MWIESAHYILLFAMAVTGLEALILSPTLWSQGSAVAIRLGFRGAAFSFALIAAAFILLMYAYVSRDFSLAVVFETFDGRTSPLYAFSAFCSEREGLFFVLVMLLSAFSLAGYSRRDLHTYQERGRYLFGTSAVLFFLLLLMVTTANPFVRISEPALDGLGLDGEWERPYKTLKILCSLTAYALLTTTFIKAVSMYSKGWHFAYPALLSTLLAVVLLVFSLGLELSTRFMIEENRELWLWTPPTALRLSILCLTLGQLLLLYLCQTGRVFSQWALFFALCLLTLFSAEFFAAEYSLFALNPKAAYFPNPIIAFCATLGMLSFFLFFASSLSDKILPENGFAFFSRESFVALAATACLTFGLCTGLLSFTPSLFLFEPDLPFRLPPDLLKNMMLAHFIAFAVFLTLAFRRKPLSGGWAPPNARLAFWFWGISAVAAAVFLWDGAPESRQVFFWSLPALFLFWSILDALPFSFRPFPRSPAALFQRLESISAASYGFFCFGAGILVLSVSLSTAVVYGNESTQVKVIDDTVALPTFTMHMETLSPKTEGTAARRMLRPEAPEKRPPSLIGGDTVFQWPDKKLAVKIVHLDGLTVSTVEADQISESEIRAEIRRYPALRLVWNSLFFIVAGLLLVLSSWKRKKTS
ncbi:MAG: hypothetical protein ACI4PW_09800 [Alphaproteobacteria bacterium]